MKVQLSQIVDAMEDQMGETSAYFNKMTGDIVLFDDETLRATEDNEPLDDYPNWQRELIAEAREFLGERENYIQLPSQFDLHEYEIMERFCLSVDDQGISNALYHAIKGAGAFHRFKDKIHDFGVADDWYCCRDEALKEIARSWCVANVVCYTKERGS